MITRFLNNLQNYFETILLMNGFSQDEDLCYDPIDEKDDPDPGNKKNSHGTSCAGIIAGKANNSVCGVGIAPLATLGGP